MLNKNTYSMFETIKYMLCKYKHVIVFNYFECGTQAFLYERYVTILTENPQK